MRFSTVLALTLATASAAPALASFAEFDARDVYVELLSRAYLDSDGKVHYAPGVRNGHRGTGSRRKGAGDGSTPSTNQPRPHHGPKPSSSENKPRELETEELFSRAYLDSAGKVHYAPGVRGGGRGTGSRPKGVGSRPRELQERAYIGSDRKVHYAPGVRGGGRGTGSRPKGVGSAPRELLDREFFYDSLDLD